MEPILAMHSDTGLFELMEDFHYTFPWTVGTKVEEVIRIPKGTMTNFASIPGPARAFISPIDKDILIAALVHDYLVKEFDNPTVRVEKVIHRDEFPGRTFFQSEKVGWMKANKILRDIMRAEGAPTWKWMLVYVFVAIWGKARKI